MYLAKEQTRVLEDQAETKVNIKYITKDTEKLRGMDDISGVDDMHSTGVSEKETR